MATRDILVLNTTASRAETQQGSDTVVIRGNSGEALSVENSSGTSILSVNTVSSSVDVAGKITATTNVSSSITSTGSFGRVEATTLVGDAFNLTNTAIDGTISSSGQIANQISGAFRQGFEFDGTIGSVAGHTTTASFDRIVATVFSGSAANLTNTALQGTLSSSAQIATAISGAFTSGFQFTGTISGSATSTGSFGQIFAKKAVGNVSAMTNLVPEGVVSGSAQLASQITASYAGGFEYQGTISGSATSTASLANVQATTVVGNVSNLTGLIPSGIISSSIQISSSISGSFNKGFEFTGNISQNTGVWSEINAMNSVRKEHEAGGNGVNAAIVASGNTPGQPYGSPQTEEWNGTNWSEVNDMIAGIRQGAGGGTTESFIVFGGTQFPATPYYNPTEEYNGTNWSDGANMITGRYDLAGMAENTEKALAIGPTKTEEYNGSAWTEVNDLITGKSQGTAFGDTTETAYFVGAPGGSTQYWNGTNWSEVNNTNVQSLAGGGSHGSANDAIIYGGVHYPYNPGALVTCTEAWDGTSWAVRSGLPTAISSVRGAGDNGSTGQLGLAVGGGTPSITNKVVSWSGVLITTGSFGRVEVTSISGDGSNLTGTALAGTISSSAQIASNISGSFNKGFTFSGDITSKAVVFSSGGDLNCAPGAVSPAGDNFVGATYRGAAGNKNAGLVFGGFRFVNYRPSGFTEEYDGTSWSEVNDMIDPGAAAGGGTSEAAIATGGNYRNCDTEEWNGTNWSEVNHHINDLHCAYKPLSIGNSSEALITGGGVPTAPYGQTETWNGTNWATANQMIHDPRGWHGGAGTQNSGLTAGGPHSPYNGVSCTETWDGTSWSEGSSALINNMKLVSMAGSQNDTLLAGHAQSTNWSTNIFSYAANVSECSICWNGLNWATSTDLDVNGTSRRLGMSAAGSNTDVAFFAGGIDINSPHSFGCTIESETFVASASFSHIDAARITASVDGMTNINPPEGAISGSGQIASNVSGSFNKGFEFNGELRSLGTWTNGADFTGCFTSLYGKYGYSAIGTRDAAIVAGASGAHQGWVSNTYFYNGVAWSDTGNNMIQGGSHSAHGTANAGLAIGRHSRAPGTGYFYTCTEEYNGSAWSETTDGPYKLKGINNQSAGTQNAALVAGGNCDTTDTLHAIKRHALAWDGLSYSHVGTLAEARDSAALTGTMNAALAQGGGSDSCTQHMNSDSTCTEEWNGSAWSTAAASNFPTGCGVMASGKSSNDSMHVYDASDASLKSDVYNGTTWSLGPNMNGTGRIQDFGAAGTTARSFYMSRLRADIEHFDENHVTSSIGRVDANEFSLESNTDLTVNESLQIPQYATNPPITSSAGEVWYNTDEEKLYFTYDINSWTEVAATNTTHNFGGYAGGVGQGIVWGGAAPNTEDKSEVWDGNTWTEVNDLNTARTYSPGGGSSNSAIAAGGSNPAPFSGTEIWDGTSWTEVNDGALGYGASFAGTVNAAVQTGGRNGSHGAEATTKEWNGTDWSTGGSLITARASFAGMLGSQNAAKHMGGTANAFPQQCVNVEDYNGTSFATAASLSVGTKYTSAAGTQNAGIFAGGASDNSANTSATFEWNGVSFHQTANLVTGRCTGDIADGSQSSFQVSSGGAYGGSETKTEQYTTTGIGCHCIGGV